MDNVTLVPVHAKGFGYDFAAAIAQIESLPELLEAADPAVFEMVLDVMADRGIGLSALQTTLKRLPEIIAVPIQIGGDADTQIHFHGGDDFSVGTRVTHDLRGRGTVREHARRPPPRSSPHPATCGDVALGLAGDRSGARRSDAGGLRLGRGASVRPLGWTSIFLCCTLE